MPKDNSWRLSATQLAAHIQQGDLTAEKAAEDALVQLETVNPKINAVVDYRPDQVMEQACDIDRRRKSGEQLGPMAGVPVTIKVITDQEGFASTNGLKAQQHLMAQGNNSVVQAFLDADAVLLGRTNTPAFSYRWFTSNLLHGHTHNPRHPQLTPGGSSGGAGAAVAAGIGAIAQGTDIAGSVRYPAYACGVHGLRPGLGRVANVNGTNPNRNIGGQLMSVTGPLARTVEDVQLAFAAMTRPDPDDIWWSRAPLEGPSYERKAALCLYPDGMDTAPELVDALKLSANALRDAGWIVEELESLPRLSDAVDIQRTLWVADGYANLMKQAEKEGDPGAINFLESHQEFVESLSSDAISRVLTARMEVVRRWRRFTEQYALVLLPPCAELPFTDDLDLHDMKRVWSAQMSMIALPVTGLPCMTVATGLTTEGIPVGIQLISASTREDICLEAAASIESRVPTLPMAEPVQ